MMEIALTCANASLNVDGGGTFHLRWAPGSSVSTDDADAVVAAVRGVTGGRLLGQSTGQIEILAHLGAIVVDALTPLYESILASPVIDTRMHRRNDRGFYDGHWTADHYAKTGQGR
jgi:hypothetical protein